MKKRMWRKAVSGQALVEWSVFGFLIFFVWTSCFVLGKKLLIRSYLEGTAVLAARKTLSQVKSSSDPLVYCKAQFSFSKDKANTLCLSNEKRMRFQIAIPQKQTEARLFWDWF